MDFIRPISNLSIIFRQYLTVLTQYTPFPEDIYQNDQSFDNLGDVAFNHLLSYLYQPTLFERTQTNWEMIRNISLEWDFPELTYIVV